MIAAQKLAQLVPLDFAGRRARQIGDHFEAPRLLVARQRLRQPLARRVHRRRMIGASRSRAASTADAWSAPAAGTT